MPAVAEAPPSVAAAASEAAAMGGSNRGMSGAPGKNLDNAFGSLEKLAKPPSAEPSAIPPHPSQKKSEPAKPAESPKAPEQKTAEEPAKAEIKEPVIDPAKPPLDPKQKKPADFLREKLAKTEQERDHARSELEKLKAAPVEDPEKKSLQERLEAAEKRTADYENELRYTKYEKSDEYKTKYLKPYEEAWQVGRNWVSHLKIDNGDGTTRSATAQDFDAIMRKAFNDPNEATDMLETMFGPTRASTIATHMAKVLDMARANDEAIENYRKNGADREKQSAEVSAKVAKEIGDSWKAALDIKNVPEKWKPWVMPKGNDKDGNPIDKEGDELLVKGLAEFDRAATEDARNPALSKEQRTAILNRAAAIRNKTANFPRLVKWLEQREARITELEKELADFKTSEPGSGEGKTAGAGEKTSPLTGSAMDNALAGLDKRVSPVFH